jgi:elongation factor P
MLTTSDFKKGLVLELDAAPCLLLDVAFQSPSARGANTMVKTKYRNLITQQVLEKTFRSGDKVREADYERHKGQYLYGTGDSGCFKDL